VTADGIELTTFNVHWGGRAPGGRRAYDLGAASRALPGDVVVYQEDWDHPDEPSRVVVPDGWHACRHSFGRRARPRRFGLAEPAASRRGDWGILVASAHPLRVVGTIVLPSVLDDPRTSAPLLEVAAPGGTINIVAVHLASKAVPAGALWQLRALAQVLPDGPLAVVGDHNLWRAWVRPFFRGFSSAAVGATWPAHRPWSQIDQIWVRDLHATGGRVLDDAGSDHRPVTATIRRASS
jgi:endonuclease/exonuclease/phosphatase family metal-dependent hydrolase